MPMKKLEKHKPTNWKRHLRKNTKLNQEWQNKQFKLIANVYAHDKIPKPKQCTWYTTHIVAIKWLNAHDKIMQNKTNNLEWT
jgi:hypothetical protein